MVRASLTFLLSISLDVSYDEISSSETATVCRCCGSPGYSRAPCAEPGGCTCVAGTPRQPFFLTRGAVGWANKESTDFNTYVLSNIVSPSEIESKLTTNTRFNTQRQII